MRWLSKVFWTLDHPAIGVYGSPVLLGIGFYLAISGPGWWEDWFLDHGLWLLISFWAGSGFAFVWWMLERGSAEIPGGKLTTAAIGAAGIVLVAGVGALTDPEFLTVAVWPGLMLAGRALSERLTGTAELSREGKDGVG